MHIRTAVTSFPVLKLLRNPQSIQSIETLISMSDWMQRLKRVQTATASNPEEQVLIDPMTLEELSAEMVTFGKAHSDRSFAEVWDHYPDCPDWTQWFFAHYQPSKKTEHRKMCLLIKKMVEESENNATYAPTTEASHAMPKRLTHPLIATAKPRPHPLPARVPRFQRPVCHGTQPEINRKPSRICSSEFRASREVSSRSLQSLATHPDPPRNRPVHLADLLPESPLAEWDDPWNA